MYICKYEPDYQSAFSDRVLKDVRNDFIAMAPMYHLLRGYADEMEKTGKE
jgi:hypothetical protein